MLPSEDLDDEFSLKNLFILREMVNAPGGIVFVSDWYEADPAVTSVCFVRKDEPSDVVLQDSPSSSSSGLHLRF